MSSGDSMFEQLLYFWILLVGLPLLIGALVVVATIIGVIQDYKARKKSPGLPPGVEEAVRERFGQTGKGAGAEEDRASIRD
jgi:hypothetical protein